jgi:hypothetical protein
MPGGACVTQSAVVAFFNTIRAKLTAGVDVKAIADRSGFHCACEEYLSFGTIFRTLQLAERSCAHE